MSKITQLSERLLLARRRLGVTQIKLADMLGFSRYSIVKWENGKATPSPDSVEILNQYLLMNDPITLQDLAQKEAVS